MSKTKRETRSDRKANGALIRAAFISLLQESKGVRPTVDQIKKETGLSSFTIKKHLREIDFKDVAGEKATFKVLTDDVVLSIYRSAIKGNVAAQKLWLQVVEGWTEKTATEHSGRIETTPPAPPVILHIG